MPQLPHGRPRGRPRRPIHRLPPHVQAERDRRAAWARLPPAERERILRDLRGVMPDGRLAGQPADQPAPTGDLATRKADPQQPLF